MSQGTVVELPGWFLLGLTYWAVPILHLTFPGNFNVLPGLENRERAQRFPPSLAISVPSNIPDTG